MVKPHPLMRKCIRCGRLFFSHPESEGCVRVNFLCPACNPTKKKGFFARLYSKLFHKNK